MQLILVHGMGRSPLSMAWLALRLRWCGHRVRTFGYSAACESFASCSARLRRHILKHVSDQPYAVIGHSLGTVLLRQALSQLPHQPSATFLLAPPTQACTAARFFAANKLYQLLTGEMGQLLAQAKFMHELAAPPRNTFILAGTACTRKGEASDGILLRAETHLANTPCLEVSAWHTFIMNHPHVFRHIRQTLSTLN